MVKLQQYEDSPLGWSVITHGLGTLTGFQKVIMHFILPYAVRQCTSIAGLVGCQIESYVMEMYIVGTAIEGARTVLEDTLGPAKNGCTLDAIRPYVYLEFHPTDSIARKAKEAVDGAEVIP